MINVACCVIVTFCTDVDVDDELVEFTLAVRTFCCCCSCNCCCCAFICCCTWYCRSASSRCLFSSCIRLRASSSSRCFRRASASASSRFLFSSSSFCARMSFIFFMRSSRRFLAISTFSIICFLFSMTRSCSFFSLAANSFLFSSISVWVSLQGVFRSKNLLNPVVVFLALAVADVLAAEDGTSGF